MFNYFLNCRFPCYSSDVENKEIPSEVEQKYFTKSLLINYFEYIIYKINLLINHNSLTFKDDKNSLDKPRHIS